MAELDEDSEVCSALVLTEVWLDLGLSGTLSDHGLYINGFASGSRLAALAEGALGAAGGAKETIDWGGRAITVGVR